MRMQQHNPDSGNFTYRMNNQVARRSKMIEVEREPTDLKILKMYINH